MADSGRTDFLNHPSDCTVLIAAANLLPALKERTRRRAETELLAFADTDALHALDVISRRRPRLVALESGFAATPRGAALIHRLRADPALAQLEIRVVSHEDDRRMPAATPAAAAVAMPATPLDYRGTRRAPRYAMAPGVSRRSERQRGNPCRSVDDWRAGGVGDDSQAEPEGAA